MVVGPQSQPFPADIRVARYTYVERWADEAPAVDLSAAAQPMTAGTAAPEPGTSVVTHNDVQRWHDAFITSSGQIATTAKAGTQQEDGLLISVEAFTIANLSGTSVVSSRRV